MKAFGKLLALVAIVGGGAYIVHYTKLISKLKYSIGQINLKYFSLGNTQLTADLVIRNDGWFTSQIEKMIIDVYIDNRFVTKIVDNQPFTILPVSTTVVPTTISFDPQSLGRNISSLISSTNLSSDDTGFGQLNIKFDGKLTTKVYGIPFNVPFTYTDNIKNLTT